MKILSNLALGVFGLAFVFAASTPAAAANPTGIDPEHYQCYVPVQPVPFQPRTVKLRDQFKPETEARVIRVAFLCAPVSKNGELLADKESHLVCYDIETPKVANVPVRTFNQFGKLDFTPGKATLLCVPSLKKVLRTAG